MRRPESHFRGNQRVRSGIFYFLCLMLLLEGFRLALPHLSPAPQAYAGPDTTYRLYADTTRAIPPERPGANHPLDPNRLDDFTGYRLGIPAACLDSLYRYLAGGNRIKTESDFRRATGLPDTVMERLLPLLRFPAIKPRPGLPAQPVPGGRGAAHEPVADLNEATALSLQSVRGVGPVLSARIVRFREALGGFLDTSQLRDVYGLSPEVAERVGRRFRILRPPKIRRVDLNSASAAELASLVYLTREMAEDIVARREAAGPYRSFAELAGVESIPAERIGRIALYLSLEKE
ncbi:helix-hairpin-helix domain-containing protein [Robiginitalea sp. SC105]|uniref:ComEA family DNA-binding protein n=1 Tax=Robiginitalea sp. SC105 TaxID=2762332 RepID=UPI00163B13D3|nr:helix-hairpin-helix domain-containing protein [Robiginitalea sp. SC105]MBC2839129.1 helix-hairpin-helix domain-containing protein [Robiginitalea sp. SC105]